MTDPHSSPSVDGASADYSNLRFEVTFDTPEVLTGFLGLLLDLASLPCTIVHAVGEEAESAQVVRASHPRP